jgi:CheY-like chemotaxis protein
MSQFVLVVEDDPTLQMVAQRAIELLGYACIAVGTGEEAAARALDNIKLIFMDIGLPGIDGAHAALLIREMELKAQRKRVPIIALTGHATPEKCIFAGMDDYLQKPALMADLKRMLNKWCSD